MNYSRFARIERMNFSADPESGRLMVRYGDCLLNIELIRRIEEVVDPLLDEFTPVCEVVSDNGSTIYVRGPVEKILAAIAKAV